MHFDIMPINSKTWNFTDFGYAEFKPDPDFAPEIPGTNEWGCLKESCIIPRGTKATDGASMFILSILLCSVPKLFNYVPSFLFSNSVYSYGISDWFGYHSLH